VILPQPASRSVRYTATGAPAIEVAWEGFEQLGIWSRDGGDFLCIEPWHGMASPTDFDGEFRDKPGLMLIPPGERRTLSMRIRLC
jgi:galactose mutarotase-like enzyme